MLIKYNFGAHLGLEFWYLVMFCILMIRGVEPRGTGVSDLPRIRDLYSKSFENSQIPLYF